MAETLVAPGSPGIEPRWTSSAKDGVGTALGERSRVWFTISHGIIDEVYHPRIDTACVRDLGLLISPGDNSHFIEEKRNGRSEVEWFAPGVPGYRVTNHLPGGISTIKSIFTDPERDVLVQRASLEGAPAGTSMTVLLAPHIANRGRDNVGWVGDYKGVPMLFAGGSGVVIALAAVQGWGLRSVGYVGFSDGWQDVNQHGRLSWSYPEAGPGNIALAGEAVLSPSGDFDIVVGFGRTAAEAGHRARSTLGSDLDAMERAYERDWVSWHASKEPSSDPLEVASRAVVRVHESISFPGATIASLSIPWGFSKGDEDMGGYHLVWPRDMVEALGGLLASGSFQEAERGLDYLRATQELDGHWAQNMWLDGTPYWGGVQMDETALPILAVGLCLQSGVELDLDLYWPMVSAAAGYVVANGPVTGQDRWEEDAGYSPFTVAAEIAALLVAAGMADQMSESSVADFLRTTADVWNESIEHWMYVVGTDLAGEAGVDGYYVRIAPPDLSDGSSPATGWVPIKNRPPGESSAPASAVVSPDALALVRFGLRDPGDAKILNTLAVIDHVLRVEFEEGPTWRRYSEDGYGEHQDGSPYDGTGIGRPWPLLTGERAHYELAAGNLSVAKALKATLSGIAGGRQLLPEQIWDGPDIPARELFAGRPSGSAMPLVWAHAEYLKLCASLRLGRVFDTPEEARSRYGTGMIEPGLAIWSPNQKIASIASGRDLRLHLTSEARVSWTTDGWENHVEEATTPMLRTHLVTLEVSGLAPGNDIEFRILTAKGASTDHSVVVR